MPCSMPSLVCLAFDIKKRRGDSPHRVLSPLLFLPTERLYYNNDILPIVGALFHKNFCKKYCICFPPMV